MNHPELISNSSMILTGFGDVWHKEVQLNRISLDSCQAVHQAVSVCYSMLPGSLLKHPELISNTLNMVWTFRTFEEIQLGWTHCKVKSTCYTILPWSLRSLNHAELPPFPAEMYNGTRYVGLGPVMPQSQAVHNCALKASEVKFQVLACSGRPSNLQLSAGERLVCAMGTTWSKVSLKLLFCLLAGPPDNLLTPSPHQCQLPSWEEGTDRCELTSSTSRDCVQIGLITLRTLATSTLKNPVRAWHTGLSRNIEAEPL